MTSKAGTQYLIDIGAARVRSVAASEPYLCVIGSPALRYQEPVRIAEPLELKPSAKAAEATKLAAKPAESEHPPGPVNLAPKAQTVVTEVHSSTTQSDPDAAQPSIIPDDMRPRVRTEEFLPFFQLPGPSSPAPQSPDAVPPSSATYRQK